MELAILGVYLVALMIGAAVEAISAKSAKQRGEQ